MAGKGDGNDSRYSQGLPNNELEDDTTLNTADATLTTADQSIALADAARQGVDLSTTEGLMSPHCSKSADNEIAFHGGDTNA
ncbi:hypothetical protein LWI29_003143 [Acer saccharum]|uniref:Uncharacterized protein n=1 Tax=Acer saccharum TaxID=4024 RepID=A0AA39RVT0_ACESA|nr:hypothetical protein LWI29_003143 [Acer saccharum]